MMQQYNTNNIDIPNDKYLIIDDPSDVPPVNSDHGLVVVIDLDETLVDGRKFDTIYLRPYAQQFLANLNNIAVDIIIWSASSLQHVYKCISKLDSPVTKFHAGICAGEWTNELGNGIVRKNIKKLSHVCNIDRMILIDNSPWVCMNNTKKSIVVPDFRVFMKQDAVLKQLFCILEKCDEYLRDKRNSGSVELFLLNNEDVEYFVSVVDMRLVQWYILQCDTPSIESDK